MKNSPRIAKTTVCESGVCDQVHLLVRGDQIEFVSVEQVERVGSFPLDEARMPSDVKLPPSYVMVNDATGHFIDRCDVYVVPWRSAARGRSKSSSTVLLSNVDHFDLAAAYDYYGKDARISVGSVSLPEGRWKRVCEVAFIRYRRYGFDKRFEHAYDPPVQLFSTTRPLAWRLPLPEGCVIDSRGFVRP